jgi:type I restriction enzyme M protein
LPLDGHSVILANPPFPGRLDHDRIVDDMKIGASTATELLFVKYMIDNLKSGRRCGGVVPEGVLSNSRVAHKELRRMLMQNNRVEAVLSLPGGVFQPYSGVKTSVLIFDQGGRTERVMFLDASNDGRRQPRATHRSRRSARLIAAFNSCEELFADWRERKAPQAWMENWWSADAGTIERESWNLSASRHRPESREAAVHRNPRELFERIAEGVSVIRGDLEALAPSTAMELHHLSQPAPLK